MFSCKSTCGPSDPTTDTVRINLPTPVENAPLVERWEVGEGKFVELHEGQRLVVGAPTKEEADGLIQQWEEKKAKEAAEAAAEEARLVAVRAEQARLAREKEEQELRERHERAEHERREALRLEELARHQAQQLAEEEEERLRQAQLKAEKERQDLLAAFLKRHGFGTDVCGPKQKQEACGLPFLSKTIYPIHCAAELGDAAMVEMLIKEGANPAQKTSGGKTAAELAAKKAKGSSHDAVLRLLGAKSSKAGGA
eukprot:CAMPEP_0197619538 /NCGR_PEP_ID=MMETSP1338-20131121/542_1 /TAXON_ID=43686 ORGANISM="Pelagodinium beii, Strain RCC1491" /NCGR_SAMPLE_ID=MMETSP1338 /ASSEMBLY_ACC=CAM_ASM_000754 /LENGTH=253 /DNA_ID=CAMNT_0043188517 /DNA_START=69 /DNA_END=830 /DNA_ORIENTATION=+